MLILSEIGHMGLFFIYTEVRRETRGLWL